MFAMNLNRRNPRNIGIIVPYHRGSLLRRGRAPDRASLHAGRLLGDRAELARAEFARGQRARYVEVVEDLGRDHRAARSGIRHASDRAAERRGSRRLSRQPHQRSDSVCRDRQCSEHLARRRLPVPLRRAAVFPRDAAVNQNAEERKEAYVATMKRLGIEPAVVALERGHRMELRGDRLQGGTSAFSAGAASRPAPSCARTTAWRLACWRRRIRTA